MSALAMFLDALPDVLVMVRLDAVRAQLRATRPGRKSRRIFARALEQAMADGSALRRAAARVVQRDPLFLRPGAPPAEMQRRLNNCLVSRRIQ